MADNTTVPPNVGGDSIRDKDRAGVKTQIVGLDLNIGGASEQLATGSPLNGFNSLPSNDDSVRRVLEQILVEIQAVSATLGISPISAPPLISKPDPIINGAVKSVVSSTTAGVLVPGSVNRAGLAVYNNSTALLYLLAAASGPVSTTLFTVILQASGYYELPLSPGGCYQGPISGVWAAANGTALVTEWSA